MQDLPSPSVMERPGFSRRDWLLSLVLGEVGRLALGDEAPKDLSKELSAIVARASAAKLKNVRSSETEHYIGVGDAPNTYREQALRICRALASAYLKHFRDKGFGVEFPERKLTVVTLKDRASYKAFLGEAPGESVGGHYDIDANQLVIFDFRPENAAIAEGVRPERLNTFTLVHEALHQLTYNTGLLDRGEDVPVAISEGLAMYGELWQPPPSRSQLGLVNRKRLEVFTLPNQFETSWIPLDALLTDDELFAKETTQQIAYAEAWVLVHYLMSRPKLLKFRAYLGALRNGSNPKQRLQVAKTQLGDLRRLEGELHHRAETLR